MGCLRIDLRSKLSKTNTIKMALLFKSFSFDKSISNDEKT